MRKSKKVIQLNKAKKSWRRKIFFKLRRREKRKYLHQGLNDERHSAVIEHEKFKGYTNISAPNNFSLINNTNQIVSFINKLSDCFDKRKKVFINLSRIEHLDFDALVVLLSIMVKFKAVGIEFNGNFPNDKKAESLIIQSGFFDYLYRRKFIQADRYDLTKKSKIHTHALKDVDPDLSAQIISDASETIWKQKRRCQGVQRVLLELMQNTNNHAAIGKEREKHWWLSVYHMEHENKVAFSFIDFGVGIFQSLSHKPEKSKFYNWYVKMMNKYNFTNNAELLSLILNGDLHRTATGMPYRGKGLPELKSAMNRNQISNLHLISNNVKADVKSNEYVTMDKFFNGTFVYWELNEQNANCDEKD